MEHTHLHIRLLGLPQVTSGDQPVPVARRQTRALLYRLAADPRPVPRAQLGFLFWPDVPDAAARRNLTRLLVLLRRSLPQPLVVLAEDECVALDREQVWCDTAAFIRLTTTRDPAARLEALRQAVDLYRGPFLDGFALPDSPEFEAWMEGERRAWERRTLDTMATLIEAYTAECDYSAAIAVAQRYLQVDELAEDVHRRLIALYAATGDRTEALRQFERCAVVLERELAVSPLPETRAVFEAVRDGATILPGHPQHGRLPLVVPTPPTQVESLRPPAGIPVPASPLIGRAAELAELTALLRSDDIRLLTLSGPGGTGKTRLAIEAARLVADDYADGAAFVSLAPVRDVDLVTPAIVEALGLPDQGERPALVRLQEALRGREILLVLDNFEHLAAAAAEVAALLAAAPRLKVLTTSRALLRITGEFNYDVPPLALADLAQLPSLDVLAQVASVALFLARVRARLATFRLTETNAREVAAICARLDGLPLAIELAAARAPLLSPRMLLARLNRRLPLLTGGSHDLPERQRTLRATIDWSYRLLDLGEQLLFERLAVFASGWSVEAAETVSAAVGPLATSTLDGLQALLDKHLVQHADDVAGEVRFTMLETIREYALERLAERGAAGTAQQAHAQYYLALAESAAPALHGPEQIGWFDRLDEEHANLRVALAWLLESGDVADALRLAAALHWFWYVRCHLTEGRAWLERALAVAEAPLSPLQPAAVLARARYAAGNLAFWQGDLLAARDHLQASAAVWRDQAGPTAVGREARRMLIWTLGALAGALDRLGDGQGAEVLAEMLALPPIDDPHITATYAMRYGVRLLEEGQVGAAKPLLLDGLNRFRRLGDMRSVAEAVINIGVLALWEGDVPAARLCFAEGLSITRQLKDRAIEAFALNNLGEAARLDGDDPAATEHYTASLKLYRDLDNRGDSPRLLHNLGYVALHSGDATLARTRFVESLADFRAIGAPRGMAEAIAGLAAVAASTRTDTAALYAARLWGAADRLHAAEGSRLIWPADQAEITRYQALARDTVSSPAFDAAYAEGAALSLDEAVAEALRV